MGIGYGGDSAEEEDDKHDGCKIISDGCRRLVGIDASQQPQEDNTPTCAEKTVGKPCEDGNDCRQYKNSDALFVTYHKLFLFLRSFSLPLEITGKICYYYNEYL